LLAGILVLLLVWAALVPLRLLERAGLRQPASERLLGGAPDEAAAEMLMGDLEAAGVETRGIDIYVLPITDSDARVVIAVLDASLGFGLSGLGDDDVVLGHLKALGTGASVRDLDIEHAAILYRDERGEHLLTLTASTEDIRAYADDEINEDEFVEALSADFDLLKLYGEVAQ
jgi:hypothetical protein